MNRTYRKTVIAGNWKMNMLASELKQFSAALRPFSAGVRGCETVICAPYPLIPPAVRAFRGCHVAVGAQNLSEYGSGAYTGEVSAAQLLDIGASYVIVGHSERRAIFGETDETVARKLRTALESGLRPILCVGETAGQRELGITSEHISIQVKAALAGVTPSELKRVILAYEPIWAIGTGNTALPEDAEAVALHIRGVLRKLYGARAARGVSILYGGSMNAENAAALLSQPDIDGGLIGGASLTPQSFGEIIRIAESCGTDS